MAKSQPEPQVERVVTHKFFFAYDPKLKEKRKFMKGERVVVDLSTALANKDRLAVPAVVEAQAAAAQAEQAAQQAQQAQQPQQPATSGGDKKEGGGEVQGSGQGGKKA